MKKPKCKDCWFFVFGKATFARTSFCVKRAPDITSTKTFRWPPVGPDEWCGEFRDREKEQLRHGQWEPGDMETKGTGDDVERDGHGERFRPACLFPGNKKDNKLSPPKGPPYRAIVDSISPTGTCCKCGSTTGRTHGWHGEYKCLSPYCTTNEGAK